MGPVEQAVPSDVEELGDLVGVEPTLSEMAYRLAREIDSASTASCEACGEAIPTWCLVSRTRASSSCRRTRTTSTQRLLSILMAH